MAHSSASLSQVLASHSYQESASHLPSLALALDASRLTSGAPPCLPVSSAIDFTRQPNAIYVELDTTSRYISPQPRPQLQCIWYSDVLTRRRIWSVFEVEVLAKKKFIDSDRVTRRALLKQVVSMSKQNDDVLGYGLAARQEDAVKGISDECSRQVPEMSYNTHDAHQEWGYQAPEVGAPVIGYPVVMADPFPSHGQQLQASYYSCTRRERRRERKRGRRQASVILEGAFSRRGGPTRRIAVGVTRLVKALLPQQHSQESAIHKDGFARYWLTPRNHMDAEQVA